jgi:hypothetical protein
MFGYITSFFEPGANDSVKGSIFDHTVEDITGNPVELASMRGKAAYLVVNVASK